MTEHVLQNSLETGPALSIALVVGDLRTRAEGCLRSVLSQRSVDRCEILLLDVARESAAPIAGSEHRSVRTIRLAPQTSYASARAEAVRQARAPYIAFLEEHCRVRPGWTDAVLTAHEGPWAAVGGEVHNGNPEARMSPTIALMNYATWLPPASRNENAAHLPGHNSSFRRDRLLQFGAELELLLVSDINLHRRLRALGERLLLDPAVKFEHINETGLVSVSRGYFLWHRLYGWSRARVFEWSLAKRLFYILLAPAIPLYFLVRLFREIRRERPDLLPRFALAIPFIGAVQWVSSVGQTMGLLFGPGDSARRFTRFELNEPRPDPRSRAVTA
jgi:hypothetical protein